VPKAVDFLIRLYSCFGEEQVEHKIAHMDNLIEKCLEITQKEGSSTNEIEKALTLIKQIIYQSESKGTADIVPHNALLKGELIKRINVRDKDRHRDIIMNLHSNATVWEMKKRIGEQMDLVPKYLKLEKG
jgi:hypothetical protein